MAGFGEYSNYPNYPNYPSYRDQREQLRNQYEFPPVGAMGGPGSEYVLEENPDDDSMKRYMGTGVTLVSLIVENLLSHPFVVLRRQCQVHRNARKYHLVPVTLAPVVVHLHMRQGLTTLWKGIGSVCMVKGVTLAAEDCISKATSWPKDINGCKSFVAVCQHLLLKSISLAAVTPFYCASLVETVQSDVASEKPGFLDVFKDGAVRVFARGPPGGRLLPIWNVMLPTVCAGVSKYLFTISIKSLVAKALRFRRRQIDELRTALGKPSRDVGEAARNEEIEMNASMAAVIFADVLFFPVETVLHRLYLQGTRTIIDDLDTGNSVLPVLTGYEGFFDCLCAIRTQEGVVGLYKGLGALTLQFAVHLTVIKATQWIVASVTELFKPSPKPALTASSSQQSLYSQQSQARYLFN